MADETIFPSGSEKNIPPVGQAIREQYRRIGEAAGHVDWVFSPGGGQNPYGVLLGNMFIVDAKPCSKQPVLASDIPALLKEGEQEYLQLVAAKQEVNMTEGENDLEGDGDYHTKAALPVILYRLHMIGADFRDATLQQSGQNRNLTTLTFELNGEKRMLKYLQHMLITPIKDGEVTMEASNRRFLEAYGITGRIAMLHHGDSYGVHYNFLRIPDVLIQDERSSSLTEELFNFAEIGGSSTVGFGYAPAGFPIYVGIRK